MTKVSLSAVIVESAKQGLGLLIRDANLIDYADGQALELDTLNEDGYPGKVLIYPATLLVSSTALRSDSNPISNPYTQLTLFS